MSMVTYPLNNIEYTAEDAELFHSTRTSGVYATDSFDYSVTGADNSIVIGTGISWIKNRQFSGKVVAQKEPMSLDMGLPDPTYPRIDAVVIQFNSNKNATEIVVKNGAASSFPIAPEIVRTESLYELHLYHVRREAGSLSISAPNITDLRNNNAYCGLMSDSITQAVDSTLSKNGVAADAAATGKALAGKAPADTYEKLHQKTKIPNGADLNAYTTPGSFAIVMASEGARIANVPYESACGTLIVTSMRSTVEDGIRGGVWQKFYGYDGNIYERSTTDGSSWKAWSRAARSSGDTMTGQLNAPGFNVIGDSWDAFTFKSAAEGNPVRGTIMISNNNRIHFNQQQTGAKYAERYQLPAMASGLTADAWYNLVSTKHAKVLWNNGSPTSTFAAQTITINGLADCTTIAVVMNQTSGDSFITIICCTVGATHTTTPMAARSDSANNNAIFVVRRSVTTNFSNNTISFGKGYQNNTENNTRAIPVAVIGLY